MDLNYFGTLHRDPRGARRRCSSGGAARIVGDLVRRPALVGVFGFGAYAPSKYAVRGLMDVLRAEVESQGVFVGCAFPPDTLTPGFETENLIKPPETAAVSAGIKPKLAEEIGGRARAGDRAGPPRHHVRPPDRAPGPRRRARRARSSTG